MSSLLRRAWLTVVLVACAAPPSGVQPAVLPVASAPLAPVEPGLAASVSAARGVPPCERAAQLLERAQSFLQDGELYRSLRALDQATQLCSASEPRGQRTRLQALAELGRPEAHLLAERILRAADATDEERAFARAAQTLVARHLGPMEPPDATSREQARRQARQELAAAETLAAQGQWSQARERFEKSWSIGGQRWRALAGLASVAEHEGEKAAAQRLRERATEELEREVRQPAVIALPTNLTEPTAVAHAPDGRHVAVAFGQEVVVCALNPLRRVRRFEFEETAHELRFSPDGEWLLVRLRERLLVRQVDTGAERPSHLVSLGGWVGWSSDGRQVLATDGDRLVGWDADSGQPALARQIPPVRNEGDAAGAVALSADGRLLARVTLRGQLILWNLSTGRPLYEGRAPGGGSDFLSFSADGRALSIQAQGALWVMDLAPTPRLRALARDSALRGAGALTWSPDGKTLAAMAGGEIRRWEVATGQALPALSVGTRRAWLLSWSADGRSLTFDRGSSVRWLDVATGKSEQAVTSLAVVPRQVSWSPDGRSLATGSDDEWVQRWTLEEERGPRALGDHDAPISGVSWSSDGRAVVSSDGDGLVRRWDALTGTKLGEIKSPSPVRSMRVSPDGKWVAAGGHDGVVRIAALTADRWTHELHGHGDAGFASVDAVAWSPDSQRLLSGSLAGSSLLWEASTGQLVRRLEHAAMPVYSVALSPDGRAMAVATANNHLILWDEQAEAPRHHIDGVVPQHGGLSFGPAGRLLASISHEPVVRLWSKQQVILPGPRSPALRPPLPRSPAPGPRPRSPAPGPRVPGTGAGDRGPGSGGAGRGGAGSAQDPLPPVWEPATGHQLAPLSGHQGPIVTLSWSPDGLLATGSEDGTVRIWSPTERRELLALMTLGQDSGSYARAPSGDIALLGSEGQKITLARFAPCRVGTFLLPFAFCRGRFLADELLTTTLREHLGRRRAR